MSVHDAFQHCVYSACFGSAILDSTAFCRSCGGKGCDKYYHLSCLEPPLLDAPLGVWHCHFCVRKKIEFGVYSVSEGVELVCDVKEVSFSNVDGTVIIYHYLKCSYGWFPYYFESTRSSSVFSLTYCQYMVHALVSDINCLLNGNCFRVYISEGISCEI